MLGMQTERARDLATRSVRNVSRPDRAEKRQPYFGDVAVAVWIVALTGIVMLAGAVMVFALISTTAREFAHRQPDVRRRRVQWAPLWRLRSTPIPTRCTRHRLMSRLLSIRRRHRPDRRLSATSVSALAFKGTASAFHTSGSGCRPRQRRRLGRRTAEVGGRTEGRRSKSAA